MRKVLLASFVACCVSAALHAQNPAPPAPTPATPPSIASPASQKPPATKVVQTYAPELIQAGRSQFASQCGFCHGRDTQVVNRPISRDLARGRRRAWRQAGPFLRAGIRTRACRRSRCLTATSQRSWRSSTTRRRRPSRRPVAAGRSNPPICRRETPRLANGTSTAPADAPDAIRSRASSPRSDRGIRDWRCSTACSTRLWPRAGPAPTPPTLSVRTASGQTATGTLARRDEFTITLTDTAGWQRTWPIKSVTVSGDEPLRAHTDQLPKYTDDDIHNLIAHLVTLR